MLTQDDIDKIHTLKERGYSKAKAAATLGLARGTVAKYWGGRGDRVTLTDVKKRFDECFAWITCGDCGLMYWAPRFLPTWHCPGCRTGRSWTQPQFTQKSKSKPGRK